MHNVTRDTELPFKVHLFQINYLNLCISRIYIEIHFFRSGYLYVWVWVCVHVWVCVEGSQRKELSG